MSSFGFLAEALRLVVAKPKLFLPKLAISILYGFVMLATASLALEIIPFASASAGLDEKMAQEIMGLVNQAIVLLVLMLIVLALDIWVSTWYPVLVADFKEKKELSFKRAIGESWKRFSVVFPLLFGFEIITSIILAVFLDAGLLLVPGQIGLVAAIGLALAFLVTVAVYPIVSVGTLEKKSVWGSLSRSFSLSKSNLKIFTVASIIPFLVSLANFSFAFLAEQAAFLLLFWVFRIILALVVTYNSVVNPVAYFAATEKEKGAR